jgi:hypothetical protein
MLDFASLMPPRDLMIGIDTAEAYRFLDKRLKWTPR